MELNSIAFIPDGNRRYAQKAEISLVESYMKGTQRAWDVLEWLTYYPAIKVGTFYTLSLENMNRKSTELKILFKIFDKELDKVKNSGFFEKNDAKLNFIGRLHMLPASLQNKIEKVHEYTENFKSREINLAIGYNGQAEILDAAKKFAEDYKNNKLSELNEETFKNYLYGNFRSPDLIVRTSGTQRLSGFLLYNSAYSELYFSPKCWPEFEKEDLQLAIDDFYSRDRRFGQ